LVLFTFGALVAGLLTLLAWSLLHTSGRREPARLPPAALELAKCHIVHFPQIRQSFSAADFAYLAAYGFPALTRRVRSERRQVALAYVASLHEDFSRLLHLARVLASLSPQVGARHEAERFWLAARFEWRYQLVRALLRLGNSPQLQLQRITQMVGTLSAKLDAAILELGERASRALEPA